MRLETSRIDGLSILSLVGEMDDLGSAELGELALGLVRNGPECLVLDMTGVDRVYAAGLAVLLHLQREALVRGTRLICCGVRPYIRELLRITMLDRALEVHPDLESALERSREAS